MKKPMALMVTAGLLLSVTPSLTNAETLEEQLQQVKGKQLEKTVEMEKKSHEKDGLDKNIKLLEGKIKELEAQEKKLEKDISLNEQKIQDLQKEMKELKQSIKETKKRIQQRKGVLNDRLVSMQESVVQNPMGLWMQVLESTSIAEALGRSLAAKEIISADQDLLVKQKEDLSLLTSQELDLNNKEAVLGKTKKDLVQKQADLKNNKVEQQGYIKEYVKQMEEINRNMVSIEEEKQILKSQEKAINQEIEFEAQRKIEEEKKRVEQERLKQQEEQKRQAELQAAQQKQLEQQKAQQDQSVKVAEIEKPKQTVESKPVVTEEKKVVKEEVKEEKVKEEPIHTQSSGLIKPAAGEISSEFEARWGTFHYGLDIAQSGTVPIKAAAEGTVVSSYLSSSYGNVVMISHRVNGKVLTTVYAHMRERMVSEGARVSQGQQIGIMGNTGQSFGQHLHFEVHEGPWNSSKSNAVNPRKYI
ncbi:hypothetical protein bcgnr5390_13380 [Bacillus luti]|nr:hypothetical protein BC2903_55200 [Bacillus cereus]